MATLAYEKNFSNIRWDEKKKYPRKLLTKKKDDDSQS